MATAVVLLAAIMKDIEVEKPL
jgi:hypothetical protein